ncbi:MAG: hypothetical protein CSA52_03165 [Gammaproteobacteria bacterium]|nr:MAG: hypothetical protein CSB48_03895 [Pseudomonadota bacterium]PIE38196.1 MAG: hypothetical protein CSA52_03165 [Gammaproteobacteria bacterium]
MNNDQYDCYEGENEEDFGPSKSQIKREMEALQALGEQLIELPPGQLDKLPLGGRIKQEILECGRLKAREAIRRQKQLIGKLMRGEDADAVSQALKEFDTNSVEHARRLHLIERWRDRLLQEGKTALTEFINHYPEADVQQLRQAIRQAGKELQSQKNTGQHKKLFRLIKSIAETATGENGQVDRQSQPDGRTR